MSNATEHLVRAIFRAHIAHVMGREGLVQVEKHIQRCWLALM